MDYPTGHGVKVRELIAALAQYDLEMDVIVKTHESGAFITFEEITRVSRWELTCNMIKGKKIMLNITKNNKLATLSLAKPDQTDPG